MVWLYQMMKKYENMFSRFNRIQTRNVTDGRTDVADRRTPHDGRPRYAKRRATKTVQTHSYG